MGLKCLKVDNLGKYQNSFHRSLNNSNLRTLPIVLWKDLKFTTHKIHSTKVKKIMSDLIIHESTGPDEIVKLLLKS